MALTSVVHIFAGGPENYAPLRVSALDPIALSTLSVVWHMVTLQLLVVTGGLAYLVRHENRALWVVVFAMLVGSGLLFIGYGLVDFGGFLTLPQWIAFLGAAGLMLGMKTNAT